MHKISLKHTILCTFLIVFSSCKSNENCEGVICTEEFRIEYVTVVNQNQEPVALDDFQVIDMVSNDELTMELSQEEFQLAQQYGRYPLITDADLGTQESTNIQFRGFLDGEQIISEDYEVSSDCCHILTPDGNLFITINN